MSSWEAAREVWELKHMQRMEAAENGDPEAMVIMAIGTYHIQYNCEDQVIKLLTDASDAGNGRVSWLLADIYASKDPLKNHVKIEFYCRRALADGNVYSDENEDDALCHAIFEWVERHHREWQEMEEGFRPDSKYYLCPTGRYMMNAFRSIARRRQWKSAARRSVIKKRFIIQRVKPNAKGGDAYGKKALFTYQMG